MPQGFERSAGSGEIWPGKLWVIKIGSHGHHTQHSDIPARSQLMNECRQCIRIKAVLGFLSGNLNFNKAILNLTQPAGLLLDLFRQRPPVKGLYHIKQLNSLFYFIGLEVADQMTPQAGDLIPQKLEFLRGFLYTAFTDIRNAVLHGRADRVRPERFGDRDKGDAPGIPAVTPTSFYYARSDMAELFFKHEFQLTNEYIVCIISFFS